MADNVEGEVKVVKPDKYLHERKKDPNLEAGDRAQNPSDEAERQKKKRERTEPPVIERTA